MAFLNISPLCINFQRLDINKVSEQIVQNLSQIDLNCVYLYLRFVKVNSHITDSKVKVIKKKCKPP